MEMEEEHQKTFEELKKKITSQPVLSLPRREGKFRVETDTSGHSNRRSFVARTRRKVETNSFLVKNNATS